MPKSFAPKDPGREAEDPRKFGRKLALDDAGRPTPAGVGDTLDRVIDDAPEEPADWHGEEKEVCMCGPKRQLERYFDQENLTPVNFKVHISESAAQRIPYFARILAAYPTKSLNGRIYPAEVLADAAKRYVGQPFILDHDYEDSYKVHGKVVGARYGVDESPYLGRKREGLWLDAIGLMPAELVPLIKGEGAVPALVRGVSIGGEGDAEPTSEGMKLKKFYPTEISVTAFPGIVGAHIADFQTITESYKSADGNSGGMGQRGIWKEDLPGGGESVHVPDISGIATAEGRRADLDRHYGIAQPRNEIVRTEDGRIIERPLVEGPFVGSQDSFTRQAPQSYQVPYAPRGTSRSPIDPANPGFSAAPPATGFQLSTSSIPDEDWAATPESVRRLVRNVANPNPIKDAKGEEEEEEVRRHNTVMRNIGANYSRELGPVASDGNQVHGIAGTHKHLPGNDGKPGFKRAAAVDNQPHAFAGGNMKKIPGEAKVDVGKGDDEEEEEERMKSHNGLTCEQVHGLLPHRVYKSYMATEGTEPLDYSDQFRGDPKYDRGGNVSARQAAKKVGTTTSEQRMREEGRDSEPSTRTDHMGKMCDDVHPSMSHDSWAAGKEEEEEIARHEYNLRLIQIRNGTAKPPAQGRGVSLPGVDKYGGEEEEERVRGMRNEIARREAAKGEEEEEEEEEEEHARFSDPRRPFGMQFQGEAGPITVTGHTRDLGSGITSVTVNTLPMEYQARLKGMAENFEKLLDVDPRTGIIGENRPGRAPRASSRMNEVYYDQNRYPTQSVSGMAPNANPQTFVMRSGRTLNDIVQGAWAQAGQTAQNNQERVKMAWNMVAPQYLAQVMPRPNPNAYRGSRR